MPGYVVFHAGVTDPAAYEEFKRLAGLLEFDSVEAGMALYHAP